MNNDFYSRYNNYLLAIETASIHCTRHLITIARFKPSAPLSPGIVEQCVCSAYYAITLVNRDRGGRQNPIDGELGCDIQPHFPIYQ